MPWACRLVPADKAPKEVGDMWYAPWLLDGKWGLSPEYQSDWHKKRHPVVVYLPDRIDFCPDLCADGTNSGWTVTGETPNLTFSPSVNILGMWHGYVRDGQITDDIEGRRYDANGLLIRS